MKLLTEAKQRGYRFVFCNDHEAVFYKSDPPLLSDGGYYSGAMLDGEHAKTIAAFVNTKRLPVRYEDAGAA